MSKSLFYLHVKGDGEGCDYTIGCNHYLRRLKANCAEDAVRRAKNHLKGDIDKYASVTILEVVSKISIDIEELRMELREQARQAKIDAVDAKERAELERLTRKFGAKDVD